jgi:ABC-type transporter Mla MlaB component
MIRPCVVEEDTVDVVKVDSATLEQLADLLDETAEAGTGPAAAMLRNLARQLEDVLLWRAVRGDMLEAEAGR